MIAIFDCTGDNMTEETKKRVIYRGNSIISIERVEEYPHPVLIKKPSNPHPSRRSLRSLEKEFEMTNALSAIEGVRKALGKESIENQPALILEYIDGETLRDYIRRKTLNLHGKLEIAVDLTLILGEINQQDVIHIDFNSKNILNGKFPVWAHSGPAGRCDMNSTWTRLFVLLVPRFL